MKSKTFSGDGDAIIKAVNDWLAGESGIAIRDTKTETGVTDAVTGTTQMIFHVWYDQDAAA